MPGRIVTTPCGSFVIPSGYTPAWRTLPQQSRTGTPSTVGLGKPAKGSGGVFPRRLGSGWNPVPVTPPAMRISFGGATETTESWSTFAASRLVEAITMSLPLTETAAPCSASSAMSFFFWPPDGQLAGGAADVPNVASYLAVQFREPGRGL